MKATLYKPSSGTIDLTDLHAEAVAQGHKSELSHTQPFAGQIKDEILKLTDLQVLVGIDTDALNKDFTRAARGVKNEINSLQGSIAGLNDLLANTRHDVSNQHETQAFNQKRLDDVQENIASDNAAINQLRADSASDQNQLADLFNSDNPDPDLVNQLQVNIDNNDTQVALLQEHLNELSTAQATFSANLDQANQSLANDQNIIQQTQQSLAQFQLHLKVDNNTLARDQSIVGQGRELLANAGLVVLDGINTLTTFLDGGDADPVQGEVVANFGLDRIDQTESALNQADRLDAALHGVAR